jgi:hypothetical protein
MRIESPLVSQTLIESSKAIDKQELTDRAKKPEETTDESLSFVPSAFGFSGTYSIASLKAAVDYNAKYMTVAENNTLAAKSMTAIPQTILDRFRSVG